MGIGVYPVFGDECLHWFMLVHKRGDQVGRYQPERPSIIPSLSQISVPSINMWIFLSLLLQLLNR